MSTTRQIGTSSHKLPRPPYNNSIVQCSSQQFMQNSYWNKHNVVNSDEIIKHTHFTNCYYSPPISLLIALNHPTPFFLLILTSTIPKYKILLKIFFLPFLMITFDISIAIIIFLLTYFKYVIYFFQLVIIAIVVIIILLKHFTYVIFFFNLLQLLYDCMV